MDRHVACPHLAVGHVPAPPTCVVHRGGSCRLKLPHPVGLYHPASSRRAKAMNMNEEGVPEVYFAMRDRFPDYPNICGSSDCPPKTLRHDSLRGLERNRSARASRPQHPKPTTRDHCTTVPRTDNSLETTVRVVGPVASPSSDRYTNLIRWRAP